MDFEINKSILIAGIGNDIRADDGLAFNIIDNLKKEISNIPLIKTSEAGFSLIDLFEGYKKIILIDTINDIDIEDGTVIDYTYKLSEMDNSVNFSHNTGLLTILKFYRTLKLDIPDEINFLLVKVRNTDSFSEELSQNYSDSINEVTKLVKNSLLQKA
ncbi:MAG: hydrogenase maturation protease [Spirochaetes bacterium]|nr:hydrogenase maturation protease [Spirochaetota bacterium]